MTPNTHDTTLFSIAPPDVVESICAIVPPQFCDSYLFFSLLDRVVRDLFLQEVNKK